MNTTPAMSEIPKEPRNNGPRPDSIPCRVDARHGHYEEREILHCEPHLGHTVCVESVPALVCPVCGDTWFTLETLGRLDALLERLDEGQGAVVKTLPVLAFAILRSVLSGLA